MSELHIPIDYSRPHHFIFRASITRDGVTYKAKDYGHKAFRIPIYD